MYPGRHGLPRTAPQRAVLLTLTAATLLSMSAWFSASAVIPQLKVAWHLSGPDAAWLTIMVQVGFVLGAVVSAVGNLADRLSPRWIFFASSVCACAANAALVAAGSVATAAVLRLATGFFLAGVYPPGIKLVSTWFQTQRPAAIGWLVAALSVGSALPQLIGALGGARWQTVVISTSALTAIGGLLVLVKVREGPYPFPAGRFDPYYFARVFRDRKVRLANLAYFGHMWELYSVWTWFGVFFSASLAAASFRGNTRLVSGLVTFCVIGIGAVGAVGAGRLSHRLGPATVAVLALAVSGSCSLFIGLLFDYPVALAAAGLIWGLSVIADSPEFFAIVSRAEEQAYVGTALTVQVAIGFLLTSVTIWLVPELVLIIGWRAAFCVLALGPAAGVIAMLRLRTTPKSSTIAAKVSRMDLVGDP
jgi:MFS family permease